MDTKIYIILFTLLFIVLGIQSVWIYKDAEKRGLNKWLWGAFGFLNTPTNLLIYLIVSRMFLQKNICLKCGHKNNKNANFCENCGEKINMD
ncbi:MAG: zinc ribbon domain-containing protein [Clostridiales bacterium]|nr:zinc ribbon domain-containing protein [Clostridiales bacterium]